MSARRLPAKLEVSGLIRQIEADGGFATILHKGDADGGALLLVISSRGRHVGSLERILDIGGAYQWQRTGPTDSAGSDDAGISSATSGTGSVVTSAVAAVGSLF